MGYCLRPRIRGAEVRVSDGQNASLRGGGLNGNQIALGGENVDDGFALDHVAIAEGQAGEGDEVERAVRDHQGEARILDSVL